MPASSQEEMEGEEYDQVSEEDMTGTDNDEKFSTPLTDHVAESSVGLQRKSSLKLAAALPIVDDGAARDNPQTSFSPNLEGIAGGGKDKGDKERKRAKERERSCHEREMQRKEEENVHAATLLYCQEHNFLSSSYSPSSLWAHATPSYSPSSSYSSLPLARTGTGVGTGVGVGFDSGPVLLREKASSSANISTKNMSRAESTSDLKTFESGDTLTLNFK